MTKKIRKNSDVIIFIGFMASGKTTLSKELECNYGFKRISTDDIIVEKIGISITEMFDKFGESFFREQEDEVIIQLVESLKSSTSDKIVIDCGGGLVKSKNFLKLREIGDIYLIDTSFETIITRLENDKTRPLAKDNKNLKSLYLERLVLYNDVCDEILDGENIDNCLKQLAFTKK